MDVKHIKSVAAKINSGQVGVLPTDTIYGIVASVKHKPAVDKIYRLTNRPLNKPFIILISAFDMTEQLGTAINDVQASVLKNLWPGQISVVLDVNQSSPEYLHRNTNSLAVRYVADKWLRQLINLTGPVVATSANLSGKPPAKKFSEIKSQLPGLDFYYEGKTGSNSSRIIVLNKNGTWQIIRN